MGFRSKRAVAGLGPSGLRERVGLLQFGNVLVPVQYFIIHNGATSAAAHNFMTGESSFLLAGAATELDHRVVTKETVAAEISLLASARIKGLRLSGCFTMLAVNFVSDGSFCGINNLLLCLKGLQKPEKSVFSTVWFYTC